MSYEWRLIFPIGTDRHENLRHSIVRPIFYEETKDPPVLTNEIVNSGSKVMPASKTQSDKLFSNHILIW